MKSLLGWIIFIAVVWFGWQAGWFQSIVNYFTHSQALSGKEQVIEEPDGSTTTVKYRNAIDLMLGR